MSNTTQLRLDASRALSDFRTERLLKKIQKICPEVVTLNSRYIHFVNVDGALSSEEFHTLGIDPRLRRGSNCYRFNRTLYGYSAFGNDFSLGL